MAKDKLTVGDEAPVFSVPDVAGETFALESFRGKQRVALFFLRYLGCPICRMEIGELRKRYSEFRERGAEVAVILETESERLQQYASVKELPFRLIPDPAKELFDLYGVRRGQLTAALHPDVLAAAMKATVHGIFHGKFDGDERQLPGDFIIGKDGALLHAHVGRHPADNTAIDNLLILLEETD